MPKTKKAPTNTDKRKTAFAKAIKRSREQLGLTQAELAKALGVNTPRISEWECASRIPKRLTQKGIFAIIAELHERKK
jgi:transcriptional regulator with XRE-family HTH domain